MSLPLLICFCLRWKTTSMPGMERARRHGLPSSLYCSSCTPACTSAHRSLLYKHQQVINSSLHLNIVIVCTSDFSSVLMHFCPRCCHKFILLALLFLVTLYPLPPSAISISYPFPTLLIILKFLTVFGSTLKTK